MKIQDQSRIQELLRQVVAPIEDDPRPAHDLWPAMRRRLRQSAAPVPWLDWALAAALALFLAAFPVTLPVLLYCM